MKKITAVFVVLSMLCSLTACSKEQFINIISFTEGFNEASVGLKIDYGDYVIDKDNVFNVFFPPENSTVLLRLFENEKGRVEKCSVTIGKYDSQGKQKRINTEEYNLFLSVIKATVMSYTRYSENEAEQLMKQFLLYDSTTIKKQGEMNKTQNEFHFVYYSNSLVSMFTVTNTWLCEIPETEKPESKPYFGATPNTYGESIKLK